MEANTLKVYEILKSQWGEKKASTVIAYLDDVISEKVENKAEHLATKEDIFKIETLISRKHADTIKWLFFFWIATIGTIIAIMKLL